ncbi:MAG: hypothetical protein PHD87_07820 [Candidatus Cloacimonetes bacterium]|nr:hypothetical protein [Candidatus Cloacimonadota bacterium]
MSVLLDILGAIMIGGLVLLMLITFNYQITETAERQMYQRFMTEHVEESTKQLNYVVGMAGLGIDDPSQAILIAQDSLFMFSTLWDHEQYQLGDIGSLFPQNVSIALYDEGSALSSVSEGFGSVVEIRTSNPDITDPAAQTLLEPYGFIFWVDELQFRYYDKSGALLSGTVDPQLVRAVEMLLTFRREAPRLGSPDLSSRLQLKCYLMNTFLQDT